MPRQKGQTNSKLCGFCKNNSATGQTSCRIVLRTFLGSTDIAYDYDSYYGKQGRHTCNHIHAPSNLSSGYRNGDFQNHSDVAAASGVTAASIPEPTPEPMSITTSIQEPVNMTDPNFNFNGFIQQIVQNELKGATAGRAEALDSLVETIKTAAAEAAQAITPRTHNYTVTANGAVVQQAEGRPHFKMDRILKSLARRKHVWLAGPAGSGKTTAASMAAKMLGLNYTEMSLGPATSQWDMYGFKNANGEYVPGEMRDAYENGGVMMLDEIDNANPSVLVAINAALANGYGNFPDARVKKHKDFVCIAGANTFGRGADRVYVGRTQIDGATLDRFKFIPFDYDEEAELDWVGHDQQKWVEFVQKIRHAADERQLRVIISPRASINGADELRDGEEWENCADEWIWNKMSNEDSSMLKAATR